MAFFIVRQSDSGVYFMLKFFFITLLFMSHSVFSAGMATTRHVFNEWEKSNSIEIVSKDGVETLVQVFVDDGAEMKKQPESIHVSPSLFTLAADSRRVVKIYGLSDYLKKDRESILFINVTTLPKEGELTDSSVASKNIVNMRYKLFLRPNSMKGMSLNGAVKSLKLVSVDKKSVIENNSPFHIVVSKIEFNGSVRAGEEIKPYSSLTLGSLITGPLRLEYINDSGHKERYSLEK